MTEPHLTATDLYRERWRPQIHYTPARHWVNDPNGLVYAGGRYHLFYQHNPHANGAGNLSWGHASSPDLLAWTEHPVALPVREHLIFSGSAVTDWHNTSGLGLPGVGSGQTPPLVALYTGHTDDHPTFAGQPRRHHQAQFLAYSTDSGQTWRYGGQTPVLDQGKHDFRDPKVFWDAPRGRWVMAVVHPDERQVEFLASGDLHAWQSLSLYGPAGEVGGIWEVPEFFPLADGPLADGGRERWVLKVDYNPGGPYGGSSAQYWVGGWDGERFTPETPARPLEYGKDFYAALSWSDLPPTPDGPRPDGAGRRVWLAWMNNWQYAHDLPTHPWRGTFSLPRELGLDGGDLVQRPVPELEALRLEPRHVQAGAVGLEENRAHEFLLSVAGDVTLTFGSAAGTEAALTVQGSTLRLTRPEREGLPGFGGTHAAPLRPGWSGELRLYLDAGSLEVFADGGRAVITDLLLPERPIRALHAQGDVTGTLWPLRGLRE